MREILEQRTRAFGGYCRVYPLLIEDAPEVLMFPSVGAPLYCRDEAPVNSASSLPLTSICAWLAPLRFMLALLTVRS